MVKKMVRQHFQTINRGLSLGIPGWYNPQSWFFNGVFFKMGFTMVHHIKVANNHQKWQIAVGNGLVTVVAQGFTYHTQPAENRDVQKPTGDR